MPYTEALSEKLAVVATIPPRVIATAAQTIYSEVIDMRLFNRVLIVAQSRVASTRSVKSMTVNVYNCDASGTAASTALLTGSAIPAPLTAGGEPIGVYEVTAEQVRTSGYATTNAPYRYIKVGITTSTNVKDSIHLTVLGDTSRHGPASDWDNADVIEIKRS